MSDSEEQPPKPPKPMKKTSAVPLKKETVRVTLKSPEGGDSKKAAPAPSTPKPPTAKKAPSAPTPPTAKKAPSATGAPKAPSAPTKKPGAPSPAGAPTVPLKAASAGNKPPAPAPTVQLATPGAGAPKAAPLKTQALATPAAKPSSQPLPKATVQVGGATQALGKPSPIKKAEVEDFEEEEEESDDKLPAVLSITAFALSLVTLAFQLLAFMALKG